MTEQDKDILIGKMLDSPSSLTDKELSMIRTDEELKDIYRISSALKGACMTRPEIDVEREWRQFRTRLLHKPSPLRWMMRIAAIFLCVVLLSALPLVIKNHVRTDNDRQVVAEAGKVVKGQAYGDDVKKSPMTDNGVRSEVSVAGEAIPDVKPAVYKKSRKPLEKVDADEEIDVDEYLRQQQSEIEYEIALLNAEMILDPQYAMREFMGYLPGDNIDEPDVEIIIQ